MAARCAALGPVWSNRIRALLFDLDGTLIDTEPDIALALNRTLRWLGRPEAESAQVRGWIGDGARALLDKALDASSTEAQWARFSFEYDACCGEASRPYHGVAPMLERLRAAGVKLAMVTNKEARFVHRLLTRHDLGAYFDVLVAGDTLPLRKPHPDGVFHALAALDVAPAAAALIGDSVIDIRTARAAGVQAWFVGHGYGTGDFAATDRPDVTIDHFEALAAGFACVPGWNDGSSKRRTTV